MVDRIAVLETKMGTLQEQVAKTDAVVSGRKIRLDAMDVASKFVTTTLENATQANEAEHEVFSARMDELEL